MGLFDTIVIDERQLQTKALGAWGNTFHPGDPAFVRYLSQNEQEYERTACTSTTTCRMNTPSLRRTTGAQSTY